MINRLARSICLVAGLGLLAATPPPAAVTGDGGPQLASGRGKINFGEHGHGVGFFEFRILTGDKISGSLLFAAEDHGYPDIIVRVETIEDVTFRGKSIKFTAEGMLHDDPVHVSGSAFDGAGTERRDEFAIKCTNDAGEVVLSAKGTVSGGDISIGDAD